MKKFLSVIFLTVLASVFSLSVSAEEVTVITSAASFLEIAENPGGNFILANDIDLKSVTLSDSIAENFSGTLDGCGFSVKNINITTENTRIGIFDTLSGTLSDITFEGNISLSQSSVGAAAGTVCATLQGGTLKNVVCNVDITVTSPDASVGGIAANGTGRFSVTGCKNYGSITFQNSKTGSVSYAGGIIATVKNAGAVVTDCENSGAVTCGGEKSGNMVAGGIVGFVNAQSTVSRCINEGQVSLTALSPYSGGIVGIAVNYGVIKECENLGAVGAFVTSNGKEALAGGIAANIAGGKGGGSVCNCANYGSVTAEGSNSYAGGIVAVFNGLSLLNTYSDEFADISGAASGRTVALVEYSNKNTSNYTERSEEYPDFDFENIWTSDGGYPRIANISHNLSLPGGFDWSVQNGTLQIRGRGQLPDYTGKNTPWYGYLDSISCVTLEEGITGIGNWTFGYLFYARIIELPSTLERVGSYAFYKCFAVQELFLPDTVNYIGGGAFAYCTKLENFALPKDCRKVLKSSFYGCKNLKRVYYTGEEKEFYNTDFTSGNGELLNAELFPKTESGTFWTYNSGVLTVSGNGMVYNSKAKGAPWFEYAEKVTEVVIEEGVTSVGNYAFAYFSNLEKVTFPQSLTYIGASCFYKCSSLESVCLPENLTFLGSGAFYANSSLESITLPAGVTSIGKYTLQGCDSLKNILYGGSKEQWAEVTVQNYNDPVYGAQVDFALRSFEYYIENGTLYISGDVEMPDFTAKTAPWYPYANEISKITVGEGVKSVGAFAFAYLSKVTEISLPDTVQYIGANSFYKCTALESVCLPENLKSIGSAAFYGCSNLSEITLPAGIRAIPKYTFDGCISLETVYYQGTASEFYGIEISETGNGYFKQASVSFRD